MGDDYDRESPMAHLWIQSEAGWSARKLALPLFDLESLRAIEGSGQTEPNGGHSMEPSTAGDRRLWALVGADNGGVETWALISSTGLAVRVNGRAPGGGLRVLADRDEIRVGRSVRFFFAAESLAAVVPFPGAERAVFCGRCRQQIEAGALAVRCPGCGVWYDQSSDLPCWTYAQKCVFCDTRTALDAGFQWTPEA